MNPNGQVDQAPAPPAPAENTALRDRVRSLRLAGRDNTAHPRARILPWALCVILLGTTVAFAYRAYRLGPTTPTEGEAGPAESSPAAGATPAPTGDIVLQAKGYVIPAHQVQVSPKVGGMLVWLNPRFKEGARFDVGDELARIEDVDYKAEFERAQAVHAAAKARYEELEAGNRPEEIEEARFDLKESEKNLEQLRLDMDRNRRLAASSAIAGRDYEQAKSQFDATLSRVQRLRAALKLMEKGPRQERKAAAKAEMEQAKADLDKAKWRFENTAIRAPVAGTILTKKAEMGNIVNPAAFNVAASLCDMADLSNLEVELTIQERDIANLVAGQECNVMPEAYQNHEPFRQKYPRGYPGVVDRLMPIADRAKGAIPVRVKILNIPEEEQGVFLRPEMGVLVSFKKPS
jgi:HlyD family secretion protein